MMKKMTFAIAKDAPATPPNPSTAAIRPTISRVTTRFMCFSQHVQFG